MAGLELKTSCSMHLCNSRRKLSSSINDSSVKMVSRWSADAWFFFFLFVSKGQHRKQINTKIITTKYGLLEVGDGCHQVIKCVWRDLE